MTGETLLPCPWCGWDSIEICYGSQNDVAWAQCPRCHAETGGYQDSEMPAHLLREHAVREWNTRALAPALDRVIAEVESRLTALWKDVNSQPHTPSTTHRAIERLEIMATELQVLRAEQSARRGRREVGGG